MRRSCSQVKRKAWAQLDSTRSSSGPPSEYEEGYEQCRRFRQKKPDSDNEQGDPPSPLEGVDDIIEYALQAAPFPDDGDADGDDRGQDYGSQVNEVCRPKAGSRPVFEPTWPDKASR